MMLGTLSNQQTTKILSHISTASNVQLRCKHTSITYRQQTAAYEMTFNLFVQTSRVSTWCVYIYYFLVCLYLLLLLLPHRLLLICCHQLDFWRDLSVCNRWLVGGCCCCRFNNPVIVVATIRARGSTNVQHSTNILQCHIGLQRSVHRQRKRN